MLKSQSTIDAHSGALQGLQIVTDAITLTCYWQAMQCNAMQCSDGCGGEHGSCQDLQIFVKLSDC